MAGRLLALGLAKGDRVAALGTNSDAYLLLYLGCAGFVLYAFTRPNAFAITH